MISSGRPQAICLGSSFFCHIPVLRSIWRIKECNRPGESPAGCLLLRRGELLIFNLPGIELHQYIGFLLQVHIGSGNFPDFPELSIISTKDIIQGFLNRIQPGKDRILVWPGQKSKRLF